jgi:hypothetical protein
LQSSQDDPDEPTDRGLGRQGAGCGDGVEAVARQLVWRDIVADVTARCALAYKALDEVMELLLGLGDVRTLMRA